MPVLTICIAMNGVCEMMGPISGGMINPAIALSQIIWQAASVKYDSGESEGNWTGEYALGYLIGPFLGAILAANVFGLLKKV